MYKIWNARRKMYAFRILKPWKLANDKTLMHLKFKTLKF